MQGLPVRFAECCMLGLSDCCVGGLSRLMCLLFYCQLFYGGVSHHAWFGDTLVRAAVRITD
ncbi:hypothetical protein CI610_02820 [invertebrate metagenome]|uniref:Uncharacterized protein n=1 Tax=invertebrate metagenome TaxID=1711999 RepID=A0A2H9T4V4_9ZZZZ